MHRSRACVVFNHLPKDLVSKYSPSEWLGVTTQRRNLGDMIQPINNANKKVCPGLLMGWGGVGLGL